LEIGVSEPEYLFRPLNAVTDEMSPLENLSSAIKKPAKAGFYA